jgi:hypothetical protein
MDILRYWKLTIDFAERSLFFEVRMADEERAI